MPFTLTPTLALVTLGSPSWVHTPQASPPVCLSLLIFAGWVYVYVPECRLHEGMDRVLNTVVVFVPGV